MTEPLLLRRGLSFERLESFLRVAEAGSIVKAAQGDPVRQSLYSRQIRELSEFFGAELFQRDGRGIKLTPAGRRLAQLAREQFAALRDFQQETARAPVTLSVAAGTSVLEWVVAPLLPRLWERLGAVQISLLNKRSRDIVRDLQDLKVDVGVVRASALQKGLKSAPFLEVSYSLMVPASLTKGLTDRQVLAHLDKIPLAIAVGESFLPQFTEAVRAAGWSCTIGVYCSSFTQAAGLVASGKFGAVLPSLASDRIPPTSCRRIEVPCLRRCDRTLRIAWNPRLASVRPIIARAVELLRSEVPSGWLSRRSQLYCTEAAVTGS